MHFRKPNICANKLEAEVIFLDAGLRMDGIPALDLLNLVIEVFHSSPNQINKTKDASHGETSRQTPNQTCENRFQPRTTISI